MGQAARTYRCEVDTLTLSIEQKALAEERIREAGLQDLVRVHLMDYREIPSSFEKKFDAFISVEMLEVSFCFCYLKVDSRYHHSTACWAEGGMILLRGN